MFFVKVGSANDGIVRLYGPCEDIGTVRSELKKKGWTVSRISGYTGDVFHLKDQGTRWALIEEVDSVEPFSSLPK